MEIHLKKYRSVKWKKNDTNNLSGPSYWSWHKAQKAGIAPHEAEEEHSPVPARGLSIVIATCLSYFCHVHFPSWLLCVPGKYCVHVSQLSHERVSGAEKSRLYRVQWRRGKLHCPGPSSASVSSAGPLRSSWSFELHPSTDRMWIKTHSYMNISTIFTQARSVFYWTLSCFNILRSFLFFPPISSSPNDISQPQRHPTDTHHASFHFCPTVKQLRPIW